MTDAQRSGPVLLTGATGYIASHTWLTLLAAGFRTVGIDNFSNSSPRVLERLKQLTDQPIVFEEADVCDPAALQRVFAQHKPVAVVHFAAYKAVGESNEKPLAYYRNNIGGLVNVCETMLAHGCKRFVFSSSATVYGDAHELPIREASTLSATNPYGATKLFGERIVADVGRADPQWAAGTLRYFNPIGAHDSGMIGEDPRGIPNNLVPYVAQVAVGRRPFLQVFGDDYPTPDGTGVRDYIHVMDLAEGHVAALRRLLAGGPSFTVNLGTGRGYSVLEMIRAYENASGRPVPYRIVPRRPGDVAACYADPTLAKELLGWRARYDLARMCEDSWRWQHLNPNGYAEDKA